MSTGGILSGCHLDLQSTSRHSAHTPIPSTVYPQQVDLECLPVDEQLVRSLVAGGADINECDELLGSPLVTATLGYQGDIARLLFQQGADAEQGVGFVGSSFVVAASQQMKELVRLFLQAGHVNPNQKLFMAIRHSAGAPGMAMPISCGSSLTTHRPAVR